MDRLPGLVYNIKSLYGVSGCEIIVAEQDSNEGFKLGQMRNLGFKKSKGDIIVFIDVDMRFKEKLDFKKLLSQMGEPFVAWRLISQIEERTIGNYKVISKGKISYGEGGCIVLTRKQFMDSCGYSNLFIGWGKEDHLLCYRFSKYRFTKLNVEMYHVIHEKDRKSWGVAPNALEHNTRMVSTDVRRKKSLDGYEQTVAKEKLVKLDGMVMHYFFSNVRVPEDFAYMDLYDKTESFNLKKQGML